jgi:hypothetical protein
MRLHPPIEVEAGEQLQTFVSGDGRVMFTVQGDRAAIYKRVRTGDYFCVGVANLAEEVPDAVDG